MNPVRVYLALLLAAQFIVPLAPSWGAFVPHEHWARARLTSADWVAHVQEHTHGPNVPSAANAQTGELKIISTVLQTCMNSFPAPLANHTPGFEFAPSPRVLLRRVLAHEFSARVVSYPPPDQPPTL
ncbi:MAG: hypothetical protein IT331_20265 [Anaerolineae bacterium]|nr:hypothetical protein [Anaerolineae bacterium]